jgi:uncharacterized repeat protein (TIGR01451 family)
MIMRPEFGLSVFKRASISFALIVALTCLTLSFSQPSLTTAHAFASDEYITVYADDCITLQSVFNPGDTVCVEAGSFSLPLDSSFRYRRFQWIAPNGAVVDVNGIKVDPQNDKLIIPLSGEFAQLGTWKVTTMDASAEGYAVGKFIVRAPREPATDLTINKTGPDIVYAGDRVEYLLHIVNSGPDPTPEIEIIDEVPNDMLFVGLKQQSGPFFECATPARGETGQTVCKAKGLALNESATFLIYYQVDNAAREGTTSSSSARVSSATRDLNGEDNISTTKAEVVIKVIEQ